MSGDPRSRGTVPGDGWPAPETLADHPLRAVPSPDRCDHTWVEMGGPGDEWLRCVECEAENDL